jgi:hypothetical protein
MQCGFSHADLQIEESGFDDTIPVSFNKTNPSFGCNTARKEQELFGKGLREGSRVSTVRSIRLMKKKKNQPQPEAY